MATGVDPSGISEENLDDLLKCTICLETFKEPRFLPCLHSFCKSCIHTYLDSYKEKKGEIPCPVCREPFSSVDGLNDIEAKVNALPGNSFVLSLLQRQPKAERKCNSCDVYGTHNEASFWCGMCEEAFCDRCIKYHKSNKLLTKHKIVSIKDMQNKSFDPNEAIILCEVHHDRVVEVFCVDHKKACCTLCATLSHRKCEQVISIKEAAAGIKEKTEVVDLLSKLKEFEGLLADVISCRNENEETFETEATNIETAVTKIVKEMKDHLDKMHNKILSELEAAKKQMSMKVTDDINDFTSYKSAVTNWKNLLTGVLHHGSEQQCLAILNKIAPKVEKLQDEVKNAMIDIRNASVRFNVSSFAKEFNEKTTSIGELKVKDSKLKIESGDLKLCKTDFRNGEIKVIKTINITPSGQTSGIFIDGTLLFTVYSTKKIVKYNQNSELMGELTVPSYPTDLCQVSQGRVVIASNANVLYIVDCKDMALQKTMKLNDVPVYGICVLDTKQFLVSNYKISWIDQSSGTKIKSVENATESYFISTSGNNDYLYKDVGHAVSYVVNDIKKFTYTHNQLSRPYGNGIDDEGNFWIAGFNSQNIHQITDTGEFIRIIPSSDVGIQTPWTIRFEKGSNRFLVTCYNTGKASLCCID